MSNKEDKSCYTNSCCFCFSLRTGCLIMGYVGLVSVIILIAWVSTGIGAIISLGEKNGSFRDVVPLFVAISGVLLFLLAVNLVFNILLLVGLHKKKPGLVKAYLVYNTVFLVIFSILTVIVVIMGYGSAELIISRIIQILISSYFLVVIRSHYLDMKNPSSQNQKV